MPFPRSVGLLLLLGDAPSGLRLFFDGAFLRGHLSSWFSGPRLSAPGFLAPGYPLLAPRSGLSAPGYPSRLFVPVARSPAIRSRLSVPYSRSGFLRLFGRTSPIWIRPRATRLVCRHRSVCPRVSSGVIARDCSPGGSPGYPRVCSRGSSRDSLPRRRLPAQTFPDTPLPDTPLPGMPHARVALGLAVPPRGGSRPRGCFRHPGSRTPLSMLQALSPRRLPRLPGSGTGAPSVPADAGAGSLHRKPGEVSRGAAAPRLSAVAAASAARSPRMFFWCAVLAVVPGYGFPRRGSPGKRGHAARGEGHPAGGSRQRPFGRWGRRVCRLGPTALSCARRSSWLPAAPRRTPPHPATPRRTPPYPARTGGTRGSPRRYDTGGGGVPSMEAHPGPPGRGSVRRATAHPGRSRAHWRAGGAPRRRLGPGAL